mmetsp:Transcript_21589/g.33403  ORF Transcript_21589/g.33403 Transcript_21589/m.33403 type:complete len:339 (+) Transcript_21589:269-1285(+)
MDIPPNSKNKQDSKRWKDACDAEFKTRGVFAGYRPWSTDNIRNPTTEKFKPLVKGIIKHFSEAYDKRGNGDQSTLLEQMAFNLQTNMNAAARAKADQANRKAAQRIQSETVEADMGFDMPIMGVSVPAVLPLSINREQCNAAQVLGQRSQSQNLNNVGNDVIRASAVGAATAAVNLTRSEDDFDPARSRSAHEAHIASDAAGKVETQTKPGLISLGRNADLHHINDTLAQAIQSSKGGMEQAMTLVTVSPRSKKQKTMKTFTELINTTYEEIDHLQRLMNSDNGAIFVPRLDAAMSQLNDLYEQRDALKNAGKSKDAVSSNLNPALHECGGKGGETGE